MAIRPRSIHSPSSDIRTALVYAADDELFEPAWERFMARELLGVEPIEIPGGHFPMVEDPDSLGELLDRLARELRLGRQPFRLIVSSTPVTRSTCATCSRTPRIDRRFESAVEAA